VIATDGESSDGDVIQALKPLEVHFRHDVMMFLEFTCLGCD
jgi:hypothetical protein